MLTKKELQQKQDLAEVYTKLQCSFERWESPVSERRFSAATEYIQNKLEEILLKEDRS